MVRLVVVAPIRQMLVTESLGETIPIQKTFPVPSSSEHTDATPVAVEVEQVQLYAPQTNACNKLPLRSLAITMASMMSDVELLEEIVAHPSQTLKSRARDALAKLKGEEKPQQAPEVPIPDSEIFENYWSSIKQAPVALPSGSVGIDTRNDIWAKHDRAPWKSGRLRSIRDTELRKAATVDLLELLEHYPPTTKVVTEERNEYHHPCLPEVFHKNANIFLQEDTPEL
eukprot:TRINITY_DN3659_c0_g1_i3.p2 TRINITY_DN3659_c0_g1~~TRINITY_DN3659_c0_g1_i3.p2  ORF type:complete len:240 (-),score=39.06 TRINITY_DN3659_c0_g1_i3:1824-2504(-)